MKIKKSNIANLNSIDSDGFIETLDGKKYYLKKKREGKLINGGDVDPLPTLNWQDMATGQDSWNFLTGYAYNTMGDFIMPMDDRLEAADMQLKWDDAFKKHLEKTDPYPHRARGLRAAESRASLNQNNQQNTNQEPNFLDKVKSTLNNDYTPAVIGQGLESLINLGILSKGVDKEQNRFNPYEQDVRRLTDQDIDLTQAANNIRSQFNVGLDTTKNVRSANVRNALVQNLTNTSQNSLANQALQAQQMNIGLDTQQAQVLNNLGQQRVQNQVYTDDIRARNKAVYDNELSKFAVDLADSGKGLTAYRVNESANRMMFDILNKKYADFGVSSTSFDNFMKGNYDAIDSEDLIILKRLEQQAIKQFDNGK